ncbi:MAG: hypothetical protein Q8R18_02115 [bacterium]|nr:hypothetical protein [bacterium]
MVETIAIHRSKPLTGSLHYVPDNNQALICALVSVYNAAEVPLGNSGLGRQRALGNADVWNNWFYGCPQVQGKFDDKKMIFFDDRIVDVAHLEDHPLLNPSFLHDNWSKMKNGALAVPREYFSALVELSRVEGSGVRALSHADMGTINNSFGLSEAKANAYLKNFLGLSEVEREAYLEEHKRKHGEKIYLYYALKDAEQEEAEGRLSVFSYNFNLDGISSLGYSYARLLGVRRGVASVASSSAEGATPKISSTPTLE